MARPDEEDDNDLSPRRGTNFLFGGDRPWDPTQWISADDRVRGGRSQSHLRFRAEEDLGPSATFTGHLDITALGGAGFASQRTADGVSPWDLTGYEALVLDVLRADGKKYTVVLKDTVLPRRDDGREQSTISWEYDFVAERTADGRGRKIVLPIADFRPTYRGRPKPDAEPLDLADIKRFSFMMRSFFGEQEGDFSLTIRSLAAVQHKTRDNSVDTVGDIKHNCAALGEKNSSTHQGWSRWLCGWSR